MKAPAPDTAESVLRNELSEPTCRRSVLRLADEALRDAATFDALLRLAFDDDRGVSWRALWVCEKCAAAEPARFLPHADSLIRRLAACRHGGSTRFLLAILHRIPFETPPVALLDDCLERMSAPAEPPAVQALAVKTAFRLCSLEPALFDELRLLLEEAAPVCNSPAARAAIRHTLDRIRRRNARPARTDRHTNRR